MSRIQFITEFLGKHRENVNVSFVAETEDFLRTLFKIIWEIPFSECPHERYFSLEEHN